MLPLDIVTLRLIMVGMEDNKTDAPLPTVPEVGMAATVAWITDRQAATVVYVTPSCNACDVQIDKSKRTDGNGMSESQVYDYSPDPDGKVMRFHRVKDGSYKGKGTRLWLGVRRTYHDFSY